MISHRIYLKITTNLLQVQKYVFYYARKIFIRIVKLYIYTYFDNYSNVNGGAGIIETYLRERDPTPKIHSTKTIPSSTCVHKVWFLIKNK